MSHARAHHDIIAIGASAGGLHVLRQIVADLPSDLPAAILVVLHVGAESQLVHILDRVGLLPVVEAQNGAQIKDKMAIEPDHIYVIPPNASLTLEKGLLRLAKLEVPRGLRSPIDTFFTSLAADCGASAACVVLSDTGSDGTIGLRAIKEHGGLALAQAGAEYDGMMRSALATGLVDFVLPVEEMPAKLAGYFDHATHRIAHAETASDAYIEHLGQICAILRARTGHDFSGYKDRSVQYELGGTAAFEFEPTGLSCTISFPFEYNVDRAGVDGTADGV